MSVSAQAMWADLTEHYGARWLRDRGRTPSPQWAETAEKLSPAQREAVIAAVKAKHPTHPVTLAEIEKIAKEVQNRTIRPGAQRAYWRSSAVASIEGDGRLYVPGYERLWGYGERLFRRWDGDGVIGGTAGNSARALVEQLAIEFEQRECSGEDRNKLLSDLSTRVFNELQKLRTPVFTNRAVG